MVADDDELVGVVGVGLVVGELVGVVGVGLVVGEPVGRIEPSPEKSNSIKLLTR